jgi:hypothetical protein
MRRDLLCNLQAASILEVRGNPRRPEGVVSDLRMDAGSLCPRAAYYRAIGQFLAWSEHAGYQHLEDIEPITVAAYIETFQRRPRPTVKQHMAAIRPFSKASVLPLLMLRYQVS